MKLVSFMAAVAVASLSVPAAAENKSDSTADKPKVEKLAEKKICKTIPRTGSNIRDKFCLTKKEWDKVDDYVNE